MAANEGMVGVGVGAAGARPNAVSSKQDKKSLHAEGEDSAEESGGTSANRREDVEEVSVDGMVNLESREGTSPESFITGNSGWDGRLDAW